MVVAAVGGEGNVEDAEPTGSLDRASREDVCDNADGAREGGEEALEGRLEGLGGLEETKERRER